MNDPLLRFILLLFFFFFFVSNRSMRPRHWAMLAKTCGVKSIDPKNPKFMMSDILSLNLHEAPDDVSEVVETAQKELKIETKLTAIEKNWAAVEMDYTPSRSNVSYRRKTQPIHPSIHPSMNQLV